MIAVLQAAAVVVLNALRAVFSSGEVLGLGENGRVETLDSAVSPLSSS